MEVGVASDCNFANNRLQLIDRDKKQACHMPVCPELSEGGGDVCLLGGVGAGAPPLK